MCVCTCVCLFVGVWGKSFFVCGSEQGSHRKCSDYYTSWCVEVETSRCMLYFYFELYAFIILTSTLCIFNLFQLYMLILLQHLLLYQYWWCWMLDCWMLDCWIVGCQFQTFLKSQTYLLNIDLFSLARDFEINYLSLTFHFYRRYLYCVHILMK